MESRVASSDGFTVVEVLVAITIIVIALLGAALLFENGIVTSGNTRNRVIAQQIASTQLEKVRGTAADPTQFTTITAGTTTFPSSVNGLQFTVQQTVDFVSQGSTQSTCDAPGTNSGLLLRVREKVTWVGMQGTAPIREATVLAPPVGAYSAASGSIAVKVFDSTSAPAAGINVQISGPSSQTIQTTPEGCAFFAFIAPGTYTVTVTQGTGVGDQENLAPSQTTSVSVGQTASLQFSYDNAATINVTGWSNSSATPASGIPISVANSGLQPYSQYSFGTGITSLTPLFPYSSGYTLFAGNCTDNNPLGKDTNRALFYPTQSPTIVPVTPNGTSSATVPLYPLSIVVVRGATPVAGTVPTLAETTTYPTPYTAACTTGTATGPGASLGLVTTSGSGSSTTAVPLGHFTITAKCTPPNAACSTGGVRTGTLNIWVKPDAVYAVNSSTGAATTAYGGPITVTIP